MSKDSNIWFPLYADSFLSHTLHLNNTSLGCYIKLLTVCFLQKDCHLQVRNLHKICGYPNGIKWQTIWNNDLKDFFIYSEDKTKVTNKRLLEEFKKIQLLKVKRSESGKRGNAKRWASNKESTIALATPLKSESYHYKELELESIKETQEKKRLQNVRFNRDMINNNI